MFQSISAAVVLDVDHQLLGLVGGTLFELALSVPIVLEYQDAPGLTRQRVERDVPLVAGSVAASLAA